MEIETTGKMMPQARSRRNVTAVLLPVATALLAVGIFAVDAVATQDIAIGTLYVAVVLIAARFCTARELMLVGAGCAALTILSYLLSPPIASTAETLLNVALRSAGIGLATVLAVQSQSAQTAARESERRYRDVQTELAHANRVASMGQLTASIAHEVNQPIAATRSNAAAALLFLSRNPPDLAEARETLKCIADDADRAGEIVHRIRAHVQKVPARNTSFDINDAINELIALTRSEMTKKRVTVRIGLTEGLSPVRGDRVQLQQVALNLILNAVEAMNSVDDTSRDLSISTEPMGADKILVAVRDSGPGIDPECLERVFDSFYTTKPSGMGLGLSICRSIVHAHGGRLWADANEPGGAVFQFILPAGNKGS